MTIDYDPTSFLQSYSAEFFEPDKTYWGGPDFETQKYWEVPGPETCDAPGRKALAAFGIPITDSSETSEANHAKFSTIDTRNIPPSSELSMLDYPNWAENFDLKDFPDLTKRFPHSRGVVKVKARPKIKLNVEPATGSSIKVRIGPRPPVKALDLMGGSKSKVLNTREFGSPSRGDPPVLENHIAKVSSPLVSTVLHNFHGPPSLPASASKFKYPTSFDNTGYSIDARIGELSKTTKYPTYFDKRPEISGQASSARIYEGFDATNAHSGTRLRTQGRLERAHANNAKNLYGTEKIYTHEELMGLVKFSDLDCSDNKFMGMPIPSQEALAVLASYLQLPKPSDNSLPGSSFTSGNEGSYKISFLCKHEKSFLAFLYVRGCGHIPQSCEPASVGFTWASLSQRGRLRSDPVEVQEFFFGVEPLVEFDFDLFEKLPIELRLMILKMLLEPRTIEMRFSESENLNDPEHTKFDFFFTAFPAAAQLSPQTRSDLLYGKYAPYKQIFDHEQCVRKTWIHPELDVLHIPRSWNCMQLYRTIVQLSPECRNTIKKLSILIDFMELPNMWIESTESNIPGGMMSPLLEFFRRLEQVEFYHRVENERGDNGWYNIHPGRFLGDCTHRPGSRFCFPRARTVRLREECGLNSRKFPANPRSATMRRAARWLARFGAWEKKRAEKAKKLLKAATTRSISDHSASLSLEIEKLKIEAIEAQMPKFKCTFAHITRIVGHEFCPFVGPQQSVDSEHGVIECCDHDHDGYYTDQSYSDAELESGPETDFD
ncbi:hypothetical protein BDZ45DRAFT_744569 [Acephala macrosclerotiorum]|nr:hypothetical protein BDZ45DRAFT_744569 [Acephala macrosclerotiorum]